MAIEFTFHGDRPRDGTKWVVEALGGQAGDAVTVAIGAVSAAVETEGLYRIVSDAACRVKIGAGLAAGAAAGVGEPWPVAPWIETRFLRAGDKIAVDAL